jgi:hypothetical protein
MVDGGTAATVTPSAAELGDDGCAFILDDAETGGGRRLSPRRTCGVERRPGSPYCPHHHVICHVVVGSIGENRRLRETEALAVAVGGRRGRPARVPPDRFLRRLERTVRDFSRTDRSCIVPGGKE